MKQSHKRIFISNLPPDIEEKQIQEQFSDYGTITSVEIKQRKEITNQNTSSVFAFVNIQTDDWTLKKCFQDFTDYDWRGYKINLQVAKESFLERLKREREEAQNKIKDVPKRFSPVQENTVHTDKNIYKRTYRSSSSDSSDSDHEEETEKFKKHYVENETERPRDDTSYDVESFKQLNENKKDIKDGKALEAEEKRKRSLNLMKNSYLQQKLAIKSALSKIDSRQNNKIVFDDDSVNNENVSKRKNSHNSNESHKKHKFTLFNEDADAEEYDDINFDVKKQFEGKKGHRLFELQSRYKNDQRFAIDKRFLEANEEEEINDLPEDNEKQKQFEILESILGCKIKDKTSKETNQKEFKKPQKTMLRFDPSKPEHSKFEIKESDITEKKKKNKEKKVEDEPKEDEVAGKVSKETFYKVTGNLKQALQEKESFSLLNMFGKAEEKDEIEQEGKVKKISKVKQSGPTFNPFRYDSSDSEDESKNDTPQKKYEEKDNQPLKVNIFKKERFFFQNDDDRLKEVLDFLKKLGSDIKEQPFNEKRRQLKKIVRDKIKNNMRNHRPFRKKLGRHKMIKVKKAKKK